MLLCVFVVGSTNIHPRHSDYVASRHTNGICRGFAWHHRSCSHFPLRAHTSSDIVACDGKLHSAAAHLNAGHQCTITWPPDVASFSRVRFRFRSASFWRSLNGRYTRVCSAYTVAYRCLTGVHTHRVPVKRTSRERIFGASCFATIYTRAKSTVNGVFFCDVQPLAHWCIESVTTAAGWCICT